MICEKMKPPLRRLSNVLCLILFLTVPSLVQGRDPAPRKKEKKEAVARSSTKPKKLVWNENPTAERVTCYNVYERIDNGTETPHWKKLATVNEPSFTLPKLKHGSHVFAVSACSPYGEGPRSELVVTR